MAMLSPLASDPSRSIPPSPGLTDTSASLDQYLDFDSFLDASPTSSAPAVDPLLFADDTAAFTSLVQADPSGMDAQDLFKMYLDGDSGKVNGTSFDLPDAPFSMADFQGLSAPSATFAAAASSAFSASPELPAINPQLFQSPSPLPPTLPPPPIETIEEEDEDAMMADSDSETDEEEEAGPKSKKRATRAKRSANKSSVAALALPVDQDKPVSAGTNGKLPHIVFPVPDYIDRPTPEAYKKMNSKEKRQLRNKISARNFRHRRKEYITTLEEEVASRDQTIAVMRDEMGALRIENGELRRDVSLLKKQFEEALAKIGGINPSPAANTCADPVASTSSAPLATTTNRSRPAIQLPNLSKDIIPGAHAWGPGGFTASRNLGVHHTIMPENRFAPLDGKPRHLNPLLDGLDALRPEHIAHLREPATQAGLHDDFADSNPYTFNGAAAEAYRGQLYQKIAHNLSGLSRGVKNENGKRTFPSDFRPAFFSSPSSSLSGKPSSSASTLPHEDLPLEREQMAYVAGHAASTLFGRMAAAFADAFAGPAAGSKVADVLAGRARVQVVPAAVAETEADTLSTRLAGMHVGETCLTGGMFGRRGSLGEADAERPTTPTS